MEAANDLIRRIESGANEYRVANPDATNEDCKQAVGMALWADVQAKASDEEKEGLVRDWARTVVQAVKGFSDFQDCFWEAEYFFVLAIQHSSLGTVRECIKACKIMWGTHDVSHHFSPHWATAVIDRSISWLSLVSASDLGDNSRVQLFEDTCKALKAVAESGDEYEELVKSREDLGATVRILSQFVDDAKRLGFRINSLFQYTETIKGLLSNDDNSTLDALENAVDMKRPRGRCLLDAYNTMCDQRPQDLYLQVRASRGPLAAMAVHVLRTMNEGSGLDENGNRIRKKKGKKGKSAKKDKLARGVEASSSSAAENAVESKNDDEEEYYDNEEVFLESCVFTKFLLEPWERDNSEHMMQKSQIAETLLELGVLEALLSQFVFWATTWGGCFGDPGLHCFVALLELMRYFPHLVKEVILSKPEVLDLIRQQAASYQQRAQAQGNPFRFAHMAEYENVASTSFKMANLLDGKSESGQEEVVQVPAASSMPQSSSAGLPAHASDS